MPHETTADSGKNHQEKRTPVKREPAKNLPDALAIADVGYYMDVLQGRLKQSAGKNLAVDRHGDRIALDFSQVEFDAGSTQLGGAVRDSLALVASVLAEYRMTSVSVTLRADAGTPPGPELDAKRAQAVAHYLMTSGIVARRITVAASATDPAPMAEAASADRPHLQLTLEPIVADPIGGP